MADLRISCPHCKQEITCDDQWAGQELQCPLCQGAFVMPGAAPSAAASIATAAERNNPLVPKPPSGGGRLSVGAAQVPAQPGRQIPIRNLAGPAKKKQSPLPKILAGVAVMAVVGVGVFFGLKYVKGLQDKKNMTESREAARNGGESQAGHIANLNEFLDKTEPGGAGLGSIGTKEPRSRRPRATAPTPGAATDPSAGGAPAPAANAGPVVPPKYTTEVDLAQIPDSKVNGTIAGGNFVAETVRVDTVGAFQALRFIQGQPTAPDREIMLYLRGRPGQGLAGQSLTVSNLSRGSSVPQVLKRWKTNPQLPATVKSYSIGYTMKLDLGQTNADGTLPGKIYLALPDNEQSVIGGAFTATIHLPDPNAQPVQYVQPVQTQPQAQPGMSDAMQQRYGVRR